MALIFLKVLIVFTVSSFEFHKSDCLDVIANDEWPQFTQPQSTWIIRFEGNAGVFTKAATEAKTSSGVLKCTLVNLVYVTGESHSQLRESLP